MKSITRFGLACAILLFAACGGTQTQPGAQPGPEGAADDESGAKMRSVSGEAAADEMGVPGGGRQRAVPTTPQPIPDSLAATLVISNPNAQLGAIRQAVAQIEPNLAMVVHAGFLDQGIKELTDAVRITGLDYSQPVRVLLLDPMVVSTPALVVATVTDEEALRQAAGTNPPLEIMVHEGLAVIGPGPALDAAAGYALTTFVKEPLPAQPTATLFLDKLITAHEQQIDAMLPMAKAAIAQSMPPSESASALAVIDGMLAFAKQVDRLVLTLDVSAAHVTMNLAALPKDGSGVAGFVAQQKPASFAQLAALEPGTFVFAGHMGWKGFYDELMSLAGSSYVEMYGEQGKALMEMQKAWASVMGEEFAMTGGFSMADGMWLAGMWDVSSAKDVDKIVNKYFKKLPKTVGQQGAKMNLKFRRNAMKHRGVKVSEMRISLAKGAAPEVTQALAKVFGKGGMSALFGAFGKSSAMTMGKDARKRMKAAIDIGKGTKKGYPASPELEGALAFAKQRKESMVFTLDLPPVYAAIAAAKGAPPAPAQNGGEPVVFALGFADSTIGLRLTVPLSQVKAVMPTQAP